MMQSMSRDSSQRLTSLSSGRSATGINLNRQTKAGMQQTCTIYICRSSLPWTKVSRADSSSMSRSSRQSLSRIYSGRSVTEATQSREMELGRQQQSRACRQGAQVQQALRQHSSSAQGPEVPELDHGLSGKKQAAQKKQSIWEADAQGNKIGVKVGKGAREQNGQHTVGKPTAIPNSLKEAWEAGKHAVTQDGQLGRRRAGPGSLSAAGQSGPKQDSLLSKMRAKLSGSQFRWLNEQLYTCPGSQAFELMQEQPQLFTQYHEARPCFHKTAQLLYSLLVPSTVLLHSADMLPSVISPSA